jgi:tetratricopeptide (TPR) repeat protein
LTASASEAVDAQDWDRARTLCREALTLLPGHEGAIALLNHAEQGRAREERRIAMAVQRLVDRASDAIDRQQFQEAESALNEAEAVQAGSPVIADVRDRLKDVRAAAEAAAALRQRSAEEIRRARGAFRRGRYDEALQQMRRFLEAEPNAYEVAAELDRLLALRESIATMAATAHRQVKDALAKATVAIQAGAFDAASAAARDALRWDPTSVDASALLDDVLTRQLEARLEQERIRSREQRTVQAAPLIAAARQALQRGYAAVALKAALAAQRIAPDSADVAALVEEARREMTSEDRETVELPALPLSEPVEEAPPAKPAPAAEEGGVFDWAADLFRAGLRRRKA